MPIPTISWENDSVRIIDQTELPLEKHFLLIETKEQMWDAIKTLKVRGAPAIGIAAAFGIYLGVRNFRGKNWEQFRGLVEEVSHYMESSRPTAVNLFWATNRILRLVTENSDSSPDVLKELILELAISMIEEDNRVCRAIGEYGVSLIRDGFTLLTHCNAGGLATAMYGTALAPMFKAQEQGLNISVYVDETRPLLQGARITAWELIEAGIPTTLITDNMAAFVMYQKKVDLVIVGADRIAANGDTANKIGTLGVAVLAKEFGVPFYIAAPLSTIDIKTLSGDAIPIEERSPQEIINGFGRQTAPDNISVYNPAFDVTPARYIHGIITEKGILHPPYLESIRSVIGDA
ncbi:MAG: methylthioribose-1-phosphate isomerase [Spirochaetes bacterium DG_61]|jgi:methylthioribose-1-phosphate isomerase|nr:MAG: methylthioribose-1-phosphate isomerase [Spirochaetes bacterium DG_61]